MNSCADIDFGKVAIVGVGLIGGSLAISLREEGFAKEITGIGRGQKNLDKALEMGLVDNVTRDLSEGVAGADLVVVCVPVAQTRSVVEAVLPHLKDGAIVTDVGSVKKDIVEGIESLVPESISFVGGHPIAGTEHSGAEAAFSGLFKGKKCILTPTDKTHERALKIVTAVWEAAGSEVILMDATRHDEILAAVSHLPHVIAYALVNAIADSGSDETLSFSAGGFKDFTRIASSSPEMWNDICRMNRIEILKAIDAFQGVLRRLKGLVEAEEFDALKEEFERAKRVRDSLVEASNIG